MSSDIQIESKTPTYDMLGVKDKKFVDLILAGRPQYKAYREAIYQSKTDPPSEPTYTYLSTAAHKKMTNGDIKKAISECYDLVAMTDREAAVRQGELARGTLEHFQKVTPQGLVEVDLSMPSAQAHMHLVKKIKQRKRIRREGGVTTAFIEHEIELHPVSDNLNKIRQAHGAYGPDGSEDNPINFNITGFNFGNPDERGEDS